jgi:hypothetical protein
MACACKVTEHISNIQKQYGIKKPVVKTNIRAEIKMFFYNLLMLSICFPLSPIILIYLIVRKLVSNKPISISKFINALKNVGNK